MDDLKNLVQNSIYEQKDPLIIYKIKSFNLLKELIKKINKESIHFIFNTSIIKKNII